MNGSPAPGNKDEALRQRMAELGVREEDLDEQFVRSGGHGGQNVNKTSTCVILVHKPTGISVRCQSSRQQGLNRQLARRLLMEKIVAERKRAEAEKKARIEKERRRKRKRSAGAKEKMLEEKSKHSQKKNRRRSRPDWFQD
ncbi:MAG TPA: peptide chain release factor-like protein [Verrucomicrobiae bacterium]|nr:peptide chain release factor-like protein [Verrucomicrobiae bacterium]